MSNEIERFGPYELRGELGRGAMARVWRAWDPNLEREVAVKDPLFDSNLSADILEEMGRRFVKEGKTAARLQHPGIVTIYAADVYDGRPAIVMELVEGATLAEILENDGALGPEATLDALEQLLDAVGYAHAEGVVHRDIKPDNIFVNKNGRVKLADFGIARVENGRATRATMVGTVLGTPGYMSPEQAKGDEIDSRSDLFSIGVVAYEMLSGRNPFGTDDSADSTTLLYRIVHEPADELPDASVKGLPADLRPAIMAALSKNPDDRPQTAAEFKAMLQGGVIVTEPKLPASALQQATASTSKRSLPKWLPYVVVAAVCVIALIAVLPGALSSGSGSAASNPVSPSRNSASPSAVYLAAKDGKIAIYTNSSDEPYEVSDVEIADLDDDDQKKIDEHLGFATVEEARVKVEAYKEAIAKARERAEKEAEEQAKRDAEAKAKSTWYVCADSFVTLRTSPSTNASAIVRISVREPVEYLGSAGGGWSQVRYNGSTGYVITKFISSDPNAPLVYDDV